VRQSSGYARRRVELVTDEKAEHQRCQLRLVESQGNHGQKLRDYTPFYDKIAQNPTRPSSFGMTLAGTIYVFRLVTRRLEVNKT
jgi:hypothetical protein